MQEKFRTLIAWATVLAIAVAGCGASPTPTMPAGTESPADSVGLPDAVSGPAEEAAPVLVRLERDASVAGDLQMLAALWSPDARIVDGRGTDDEADDYVWRGRDAIMDRYRLAVLPAPPPPFDPAHLDSLSVTTPTDNQADGEVDGVPDRAMAELGVDRWTLERRDGRWQLSELRYN